MSVVMESRSSQSAWRGGNARLLRLLGWVALGHVVVILLLSPRLYWPDRNSPEALFERGQQAMAEGKYAQAQELFRRVMDQQPKPPPIYAKAAEQHRLADRLARQAAGKSAAEQQPATSPPAATQPATPAATSTQPAKPFIPPELLPQ